MKKLFALLLAGTMLLGLAACGKEETPPATTDPATATTPAPEAAPAPEAEPYKIGIITGTSAQGEEELRAAEALKAKYGEDVIVTATYPVKFAEEQQQVIQTIKNMAQDPDIRAIVMCQAVPGASPAFDEIREDPVTADILLIAGTPQEDPDVISKSADIVMNVDKPGMGESMAQQAKDQGADTFVHYSFARHMSMPLLAERRDRLEAACNELGLKFVYAEAPDPMGEQGTSGAQQYMLEDVPRKVAEYGKNTAFFSTNCSMQEPLQKAIIEEGAIYPVPCCPSPVHGFPGALGLSIPEDKAGDFDYITAEIKSVLAEKGMTGRMSTWPVPMNMAFIHTGVEYAVAFAEGETTSRNDADLLAEKYKEYTGVDAVMALHEGMDNFYLMGSGYLTF